MPSHRARIALGAFVVFVPNAPLPNFSGVWTEAADPSANTAGVAATGDASFRQGTPGSGWSSPLTIQQTADHLTVEYQVFSAYDLQPPIHWTFALDGSSTTNGLMLGNSESHLRSRASWAGDTLIITTQFAGPTDSRGQSVPVDVRQALHMEGANTLVIETKRPGILGAQALLTRTIYHRK